MKKFIRFLIALVLSLGLALSFAVPTLAAAPDHDVVDVSNNNSSVGLPLSFYQTIRAYGVKGVVIKVSEGTTYRDAAASVNIANARTAGLRVNIYHYGLLSSTTEAAKEADWFAKCAQYAGFSKTADGYATLDLEDLNLSHNSTILTGYSNAFFNELHKLGYGRTDFYSSSSYYNSRVIPKQLPYAPWIAAYPYYPDASHITANFSNGRGMWQWTNNFVFPGLSQFGAFDVSADYLGKYIVGASVNNTVGTIKSVSLIDYMKAHGLGGTWSAQVKLATEYGITGYIGSAAQNLALLSKLQNGVKPAPAPKPTTTQAAIYTVKSGDTLYGIGIAHHMTYQAIMSLNGLHSWTIYPGERLKLTRAAQAAVSSSAHIYTVKSGDCLWTISSRLKTTVAHLKSVNGLRSDTIYPHEQLKY
ncbi:GH25 family lysozyme [Sporolactobacillus sp. CQH2019]|uniref:GH25 family lysozyme n=1 Tax=Sporolactobacillus sp. CQH2019 TaxID=3023512 RepID=UPI002367DCFB|nr:GH25 family lysozyme [Sporolactobacillus sp. CQH2019]MDD9147814.1 GH25 family lysozyme [Sporolactobacillus sp. CQH2019]